MKTVSNPFSDKKKMLFFSQLQVLLDSGLSFSRSFALVIESTKGSEKVILSRLFERVIAGEDFWIALRKEKAFTELDCGVVRIGEETGKLTEALTFLVDYYRRRESQKRMLINSLSYPLITLSIAVIVLVFMMLVVVPMFQQVYSRMGGELPSLTKAIITLSQKAPLVLAILTMLGLAWAAAKHFFGTTDRYRSLVSSMTLRIPLAGDLVRKYQISRICRLLHLLVSSNVPILKSLDLLTSIIGFHPYRKSLERVGRIVETGGSMAEGLSGHPDLYDRKFLVLMKVGEETNSLENMLKTLADDTSSELEYEIKQLNNVVEPMLILLIGVIVAFVLIAMYLPMFKLGMTIQS